MTIEQHQKLLQDIETLSERAGLCINPVDREIMAIAVGHLLNYHHHIVNEVQNEI